MLKAQLNVDTQRKACGCHSILTPAKQCPLENHLRLTWSPEMIADRVNFEPAANFFKYEILLFIKYASLGRHFYNSSVYFEGVYHN